MCSVTESLKRLIGDDHGQSLAEYALILTLVAVVMAGVVGLFGVGAHGLFQRILDALP